MLVTSVGICGGTGTGKTTLARKLCERWTERLALSLSQDRYYKDLSKMTPETRSKVNFDHPNAIDFKALARDIRLLKSGKSAAVPVYDFASHTRLPDAETLEPKRFLIIEGLLILNSPDVRSVLDYSLFLDAPDETRLARRIRRDVKERGRTEESVVTQYNETVQPMFKRYIQPSAQYADKIIDSTLEIGIEAIMRGINDIAGKSQ